MIFVLISLVRWKMEAVQSRSIEHQIKGQVTRLSTLIVCLIEQLDRSFLAALILSAESEATIFTHFSID